MGPAKIASRWRLDTQARLLDLYQHTDPETGCRAAEGIRLSNLALGRTGSGRRSNVERLPAAGGSPRALSYGRGPPVRPRAFSPGRIGPQTWAAGFVRRDTADRRRRRRAARSRQPVGSARRRAVGEIETNMGDASARDGGRSQLPEPRTHRAHQRHRWNRSRRGHRGLSRRRRAPRRTHGRLNWPGLKPAAQLHEGRDLRPTTDLRSVLKRLLRDHSRVEESSCSQVNCVLPTVPESCRRPAPRLRLGDLQQESLYPIFTSHELEFLASLRTDWGRLYPERTRAPRTQPYDVRQLPP